MRFWELNMKLRNKKTGEIGKPRIEYQDFYIDTENGMTHCYKTLEGMLNNWEDYKESKEYWFISTSGMVHRFEGEDKTYTPGRKQLGNYFETKEEAEKAVERLRAWKRLKDNGFKFEGIEKRGHHINFYQGRSYETDKQCQQAMKDLDLLFGGEE